MCTENIRQIFTDVTKGLINADMFSIAERIVDCYYKKIYKGSEHDFVSLMYLDKIFIELVFWLGKNANKLKQDVKPEKRLDKFFERNILEAKITTYNRRRNYYHLWVGGAERCNIKSDFMCYLFSVYTSINSENAQQVKKELGLEFKLEELQQQLKELKKC